LSPGHGGSYFRRKIHWYSYSEILGRRDSGAPYSSPDKSGYSWTYSSIRALSPGPNWGPNRNYSTANTVGCCRHYSNSWSNPNTEASCRSHSNTTKNKIKQFTAHEQKRSNFCLLIFRRFSAVFSSIVSFGSFRLSYFNRNYAVFEWAYKYLCLNGTVGLSFNRKLPQKK